jgi:hypothetical protein
MLSYLRGLIGRNKDNFLLGLILLVALGIRVWGIGFDLPNLYQPDEDAVIMPAINILKTGDLEPSRLEYGSFQIYLLTGVFTAVYLYLARSGLFADPEQLTIYERGSYPLVYGFPQFYIAARLTSAVFGMLIVLLIYMLVRRLGSQRQALIAAAITALTPMLVVQAHFSTPDTVLTFMCLLGLYLLVRAYDTWEGDKGWAFIGAGFVCGLATSTKYNGAVLLVPLLLLALLKVRTLDGWLSGRILGGPVAFLAGFFAGTPFALLKIPLFLKWAGYSLQLYNAPELEPLVPSWQWHLDYLATSREAPVFILGAIGLFLSLRYWCKRGLLVNGFALFFILAIIGQTNRQARMWLPLAPFFAAWGALLVDWLIGWVVVRFGRLTGETAEPETRRRFFTRERWVSLVVLAVVLLPLLFISGQAVVLLRSPDVRTLASQWTASNIPHGTAVAVDYFSPNLNTDLWPVTRNFHHFDHDLAWYEEEGIEYLIFSEPIYVPDNLSAEDVARYEALLDQRCPVETIEGPFLSTPGYTMRVFRVPPCE